MIILPNFSEILTIPVEKVPFSNSPSENKPIPAESGAESSSTEPSMVPVPFSVVGMPTQIETLTENGAIFPVLEMPSVSDLPPIVITDSFDDDDDDDDMDDVPDDDDEDIYEEVEAFEDFDDDFDEDFEDEFDEDYEDLAKIDDEDLEDELDDDTNGTPARYEEEFGDIDGQTRFIPDGAEMELSEEILLGDDDLSGNAGSNFNEFDDDEENQGYGDFDN